MSFIFDYLTEQLREGAEKILVELSKYSLEIFNQPLVTSTLDLMQYIGYILFGIGMLFCMFKLAASYLDGESEVNLHFFFINAAKGFIFVLMWKDVAMFVYNICLVLQDSLKQIVDFTPQYNTLLDFILDLTGVSLLWKFLILIYLLIAVIISLYQCIKRGVIYFMHIALGYFFAIGISQGESDGIVSWAKSTLSVALTNCFQVALILGGLKSCGSTETLILGLALLGGAVAAEKIMGAFGQSTGSLKQISGGIRTAASIVYMARR